MKKHIFTVLEILGESLFYLILTYTLSSMSASFPATWYDLLFRLANVMALTKFYGAIRRLTGSTFWTWVILVINLAVFALIAWKFGYIKGVLTPFPKPY